MCPQSVCGGRVCVEKLLWFQDEIQKAFVDSDNSAGERKKEPHPEKEGKSESKIKGQRKRKRKRRISIDSSVEELFEYLQAKTAPSSYSSSSSSSPSSKNSILEQTAEAFLKSMHPANIDSTAHIRQHIPPIGFTTYHPMWSTVLDDALGELQEQILVETSRMSSPTSYSSPYLRPGKEDEHTSYSNTKTADSTSISSSSSVDADADTDADTDTNSDATTGAASTDAVDRKSRSSSSSINSVTGLRNDVNAVPINGRILKTGEAAIGWLDLNILYCDEDNLAGPLMQYFEERLRLIEILEEVEDEKLFMMCDFTVQACNFHNVTHVLTQITGDVQYTPIWDDYDPALDGGPTKVVALEEEETEWGDEIGGGSPAYGWNVFPKVEEGQRDCPH